MAITTDQYNLILTRLTRLEESFNDLATAIEQFITLSQVNQIYTILQTDLDDVKTRTSALEDRVTSIEEEPLT